MLCTFYFKGSVTAESCSTFAAEYVLSKLTPVEVDSLSGRHLETLVIAWPGAMGGRGSPLRFPALTQARTALCPAEASVGGSTAEC